jgi:hypothetical protein
MIASLATAPAEGQEALELHVFDVQVKNASAPKQNLTPYFCDVSARLMCGALSRC